MRYIRCGLPLAMLWVLMLAPRLAHAAISCGLSGPGWVASYMTTATATTSGSSSITISCTRATTDPATQTYSLSANNGMQPSGQSNQAVSAAAVKIKYNEYQNSTLATLWGPNKSFAGTINFGTSTSTSVVIPYYFGIPALQAVAAGNYTDTVTATLTYGAATATATHSVLIIVNPVCTFSTAPGAISFSYTSLQATAATASTNFAVTCTMSLPYSVGLDAYVATDPTTNVAYTLNVGQTILPAGATYTAGGPLSATGSGAAQTISIDGAVAAGQAGTCSTATCMGTSVRTLTITY